MLVSAAATSASSSGSVYAALGTRVLGR
jgi:hypothetical protein